MISHLQTLGFNVNGSRCIEIGTGHLPIAPVVLYLAGAREIVTIDLHRRIDDGLTSEMLKQICTHSEQVIQLLGKSVPEDLLLERLSTIANGANRPLELLENIGIRYIAPGDASRMSEPDASFDLHFSITCLEHIEPEDLAAVMTEGRRLLQPLGVAAHLIDPSDHFAHNDETINRINFLQFSEKEWSHIGGNEFSYCNRLRAPQFLEVFADAGLTVMDTESVIDDRSLTEIGMGFPIHSRFLKYSHDELATTALNIYARPIRRED